VQQRLEQVGMYLEQRPQRGSGQIGYPAEGR